jgi:hypothetical protein
MKRRILAVVLLSGWAAGVRAQDAAGPEFLVNSYTRDSQAYPAIASDRDGNFAVVWESQGQDGDFGGIFGQRFDSSGAPRGTEFRVNTYTTGPQVHPAIASDPGGNFVVVWLSYGEAGTRPRVLGQRFSALGQLEGAEFEVSTEVQGRPSSPAVCMDARGNFVIVWDSWGEAGLDVYAQRFDASGSREGSEFRVNSHVTGYQHESAIASDAAGNFLVLWTDSASGRWPDFRVKGQRFDSSGVPRGGEFAASDNALSQSDPAVTADSSGNFVIAWATYDAARKASSIAGRRLAPSGEFLEGEFEVGTYTTHDNFKPVVAALEDGGFIVAWDWTNSGAFEIQGQRFDASATPLGDEFQVNSYAARVQRLAAVASGGNGDFVVVWQSYKQDGSSYGIFGQRYGDLIFKDGVDAGDLFRWSSASTDGGDLSPSAAAGMGGTHLGLQAVVNDTHSLFVRDDSPTAEPRYRARFYFDPNGFDTGAASGHLRTRLFVGEGSRFRQVTIVLKRQAGAYAIEARVRRNDGSRADTGFQPITDDRHFVEFDWRRATAPGASDGSFELWIDNASVATLAGIDNDQGSIESARMGALSIKAGAAGTLFFDQFESRREAFIGPE